MLDKDTLAQNIENNMRQALTQDTDGITQFAQVLATAIDTYIKGATINYLAGLVAPNGAVSGVFNGNLE